jgi:hypothetical protein
VFGVPVKRLKGRGMARAPTMAEQPTHLLVVRVQLRSLAAAGWPWELVSSSVDG